MLWEGLSTLRACSIMGTRCLEKRLKKENKLLKASKVYEASTNSTFIRDCQLSKDNENGAGNSVRLNGVSSQDYVSLTNPVLENNVRQTNITDASV